VSIGVSSSVEVSGLRKDLAGVFDVPDKWGSYGGFQLVGNGSVTKPNSCGRYTHSLGCLDVESHKGKRSLDGVNYSGKVFVHKVHASCNKPSCPVCYKFGWATREATNIENRLKEARKRFGLEEHVVASVSPKDYSLNIEVLRRKVVTDVLKPRGIIGGVLIFHAFRYANFEESRVKGVPFGWYFSPHFHVIGFVLGGYSRCRSCKGADCYSCSGFEGVTRRANKKDGWIVKVLDKRITVGGTAWYQLNHASLKVGSPRFHIATWFGVCSYRKLKVTVERKRVLCPICQSELVPVEYHGSKSFVKERSSPDYRRDSFEDYCEDGRVVWVERVSVNPKRRYSDE
jgi:hypothetical protein